MTMFGDLKQPFTLILGLGESGLSMARWCHAHGCRVRVADTRDTPAHLTELQQESAEIEFCSGPFNEALLQDIALIGISPGLSIHEPTIAKLLEQAKANALPVWGEIEFFAQALDYLKQQHAYTPKLIAITGTNGKTTVTQLTGTMCAQAGKQVAIAGNISPSALAKLATCMAEQNYPDIWVLELSSFQLSTCNSLQPDVATVLNISEDHLDWHANFAEYVAAKARIFAPNTIQVLNREDPHVMAMARQHQPSITFGLGAPKTAGDLGVIAENGITWLAYADESNQDPLPIKRSQKNTVRADIEMQRLMPSEALTIRGPHNILNALCSLALARAVGLSFASLLHSLRTYQGEPHRLQTVAIINQVEYIDDSKGTNVGATLAALNAIATDKQDLRKTISIRHADADTTQVVQQGDATLLERCGVSPDKKIILIAGGVAKGQDFSPLAAVVARSVRAVLLIGQDRMLIEQALIKQVDDTVLFAHCASLPEAVRQAAALAQSGDSVLLSPACASFDMFRDYVDRAQCFIGAVQDLQMAAGEIV